MKLPDFELRRLLTARDPRAVVEAYMVEIRLRLALLLGLRMCPRCPHCNAEDSASPCQNRFGSNMLPLGGVFGGVVALAGATEFQKHSTPHFHCNVHVVCVYQFLTLQDIADRISDKLLDPQSIQNLS